MSRPGSFSGRPKYVTQNSKPRLCTGRVLRAPGGDVFKMLGPWGCFFKILDSREPFFKMLGPRGGVQDVGPPQTGRKLTCDLYVGFFCYSLSLSLSSCSPSVRILLPHQACGSVANPIHQCGQGGRIPRKFQAPQYPCKLESGCHEGWPRPGLARIPHRLARRHDQLEAPGGRASWAASRWASSSKSF